MTETLLLQDLDTSTRIPTLDSPALDPFRLPYVIVAHAPHRAPDIQRLTNEIQQWTGWSDRALAAFVGTTHPSIATLRGGRAGRLGTRNTEYLRGLRLLHAVATRIYEVVGHDAERMTAALGAGSEQGSVRDLIATGRAGEAYLAALDEVKPSRETGMLIGHRPASPRGRVSPLDTD